MAVDPVPSTNASVIASASSRYVQQVTGGSAPSGTSSALQEASESAATTAKEAAKGDPVAKHLLARRQQEQELENPIPSTEPGKGELVDQKA